MGNTNEKLWNAPYITLLLLSILTNSAFYMIQPSLSSYATTLGASLTQAGLIGGIFSITALVMRPVAGAMTDRLNKKWMMILATALTGLAAFGYMSSRAYGVLLGFRVLHGLAFAASSTVNVALALSYVPRSRLGEGVGYLNLGSIVSGSLGPNLGIWLIDNVSYSACFLVAALFELIAAACMIFIRYHAPAPSGEKRSIHLQDLISLKCLPLAAFAMVFSVGSGVITNYLKLMGAERGLSVGIYFTVNAIVLWLIRPLAGKLTDKKGLKFILFPAYALEIAAMLLLATAGNVYMIVLAAVLKAISHGSGQPALQTECMKKLGAERSGVAVSTFYIGCDVGNGFGPILAGRLADAAGYGVMYGSCAVLSVLALVAFPLYNRWSRRAEKRQTAQAQ